MIILITVKMALRSLYANKLRSFLAMLGIIIGVGSVIAMLAIATGAKRDVMQRIESIGTNILSISPGQRGSHGVMSGSQQNLTVENAKAILEKVDSIDLISPVVNGNSQVKFFNKNSRTSVTGAAVTYSKIRNFEAEKGRFFTEAEVNSMARVAVIGPQTAENLNFKTENIGENIKMDGINFKVIGILKSKGDQGWHNPDDNIIVPYTTAMQILFGLKNLRQIDLQATSGADLKKVETDVIKVMRKQHRINQGMEDDFNVRNQAEFIDMANQSNKTFTILLGSIASISLLVGGIGIMNIMLVTVTERTREIGVRKAIGAKDRAILSQFLIEALIMTGIGGLIGLFAGYGASKVIGSVTDFKTYVDPTSVVLAFSFAVAIGIFFGYYPARRAAMLDPIQSLYYE
jgi:putative ABC transport system permease protein